LGWVRVRARVRVRVRVGVRVRVRVRLWVRVKFRRRVRVWKRVRLGHLNSHAANLSVGRLNFFKLVMKMCVSCLHEPSLFLSSHVRETLCASA
jgi:hypothetical protein